MRTLQMWIHLRISCYLLGRSLSSLTYRMRVIELTLCREFFPIPDLLNRCINFEIHPLSLTNILNVLYSIDYWLHIPSSYCTCAGIHLS